MISPQLAFWVFSSSSIGLLILLALDKKGKVKVNQKLLIAGLIVLVSIMVGRSVLALLGFLI